MVVQPCNQRTQTKKWSIPSFPSTPSSFLAVAAALSEVNVLILTTQISCQLGTQVRGNSQLNLSGCVCCCFSCHLLTLAFVRSIHNAASFVILVAIWYSEVCVPYLFIYGITVGTETASQLRPSCLPHACASANTSALEWKCWEAGAVPVNAE